MKPPHHFVKVPADKHWKGYKHLRLRDDIARAYLAVRDVAHQYGALVTSSGGRRNINAIVTSNRSRTSMHYLGRALDLYMYSGMVDPHSDPYVVTRSGSRKWRVYARCDGGRERRLFGWTYHLDQIAVDGKFIDLTELLERHGFKGIPARRAFFRKDRRRDGAAEWWHFQNTRGLRRLESTFGDELLKIYRPTRLKLSPVWKYRDYKFNGVSFS